MDERRENDANIIEILTAVNEIKVSQQETRKILLGNGEIGVCEKVRNNTASIQQLTARPISVRGWLIASAIILNAVGTLYAIIGG